MAGYDEPEIEALLQDAGIIRHRGKIEATINNAARALELIDECGSLDTYLWSWEPTEREGDAKDPTRELPAQTATSTALSKDLKKRGWKFVGPTTVYAFMQAMGLVDDHVDGGEWRRAEPSAQTLSNPPMADLPEGLLDALAAAVGTDNLRTGADVNEDHSHDEALTVGWRCPTPWCCPRRPSRWLRCCAWPPSTGSR